MKKLVLVSLIILGACSEGELSSIEIPEISIPGDQNEEVNQDGQVVVQPEVRIDNNNVEIVLSETFPFVIEYGSFRPDFSKLIEITIDKSYVLIKDDNFETDLDMSKIGDYTFTVRALDSDRFTILKEVQYPLKVVDTIPPKINSSYSNNIYELGSRSPGQPSCSDNYDKTCSLEIEGKFLDLNEVGKYQFTLIATDSSGNKTTKEYNIEVADRIAPQISLIGSNNITHDVGKEFNDPGVTVTDADKNTITKTLGNVLTNQLGQYTLTYTATDTSGNESVTLTRTINVVDRTAPVFQNYEDNKTYEFIRGITIPKPICTDNYDTICSVVQKVSLDTTKLGSQTLVYNATDSSGNNQELRLRVNIVDTTKPLISLVGASEVFLELKEEYNDPGVTFSDNFDDSLIVKKSVSKTDLNGYYRYIYSVTDSSGNTNSVERVIYEKRLTTLLVIEPIATFDLAFSIPNGFIFVAVHTGSDFTIGNEILITNNSLEIINRISFDGNNDFKIIDAKVSNGKLYIGGTHIDQSNQIYPSKNAIRIFNYSGEPLTEIKLPTNVESFDVFVNGDIIYTPIFSSTGEIIKISPTGEVIQVFEFPEFSKLQSFTGGNMKTLIASNGDVFFSVREGNSPSSTGGVYQLKANSTELILLINGEFHNIKQINNNVIAVGVNIVSFDLNGNQINISENLVDNTNPNERPFTNIAPFMDGYIVSGYRREIFYIDSTLKRIWGHQLNYYSNGLITDGNLILLSGNTFSGQITSFGSIITTLKYD
jgi:hypothetical protein